MQPQIRPLLTAILEIARERGGVVDALDGMLTRWLERARVPVPTPVPPDLHASLDRAIDAYAEAVRGVPPFVDVLGPAYMELAGHGARQWLGQFFTPWTLARMIAAMAVADARPAKRGDLITVCDPACGSGVLLLAAAAHVLETKHRQALVRWSFTGIDLDGLCAKMCAVQFLANAHLHRISLGEVVVHHGNSLTLEMTRTVLHAVALATPRARATHPVVAPAVDPARSVATDARAKPASRNASKRRRRRSA